MKERSILFSSEMVRAILYGQKTQTRPVIADKILDRFESVDPDDYGEGMPSYETEDGQLILLSDLCPYGQVGDRLWVRETFCYYHSIKDEHGNQKIAYRADIDPKYHKNFTWKPSIHMPRKASRITLEITGVRVERLQDISEEDAIAEGIEPVNLPYEETFSHRWKDYHSKYIVCGFMSPINSFSSLWKSINGKGSWESNPWVWVIEFKQI